MISVERLEKIATDVKFQPASVERVIRLIDVLHQIANDSGARAIGYRSGRRRGNFLMDRHQTRDWTMKRTIIYCRLGDAGRFPDSRGLFAKTCCEK